jgi:CBS-domain-containing membrane protein
MTHAIGGRPLLQLGMLLMILGIQLISIGLIGEMIIFHRPRHGREYPTAYTLSHHEKHGED